jgi:Predicted membrane protein
MIPDPLHPAIVHFPIALMFVLPVLALWAIWRISRGDKPRSTWAIPFLAAAFLALSSWAAVATGERDSDKVERAVSQQPLDEHEETAELFMNLSLGVVVIAGAGLLRGTIGKSARILTAVAAVGLIVVGAQAGHSGGALVYKHGAAGAYTQPSTSRTEQAGGDVRDP